MTKDIKDIKDKKITASERRAMKRKEQIARGEAIAGTARGSLEPLVTKENYGIELLRALNYYNTAYDTKDKRKWTLAFVGKVKAKELENLSDFDFHSIGAIIRLKDREQYLADKEISFIDTRLSQLYDKAKIVNAAIVSQSKLNEKDDKSTKAVLTVQDRIAAKASEIAAEFDGMIDGYITNDVEPDFAKYLKTNEVSPQVSKLIPMFYTKTLAELKEAFLGEDKDLVEGYSNFTKAKLRRLIKHYESIAEICAQQIVSAKAAKVKKPRIKKEKPPAVIAKNVKYLKEFNDLSLTSEKPEKLVGCSEAWIYNTKYKKINVYRADDDGKMTVKGSAIIGYSVAKSSCKTLRKPEQTKEFLNMTKRTFDTAFKAIKAKESAVNGRINQDCVILKVFG